MNKKLFENWLRYEYPLTIINDRYRGTYSGGEFLAFPLDFCEIDDDVSGGDVECASFWDNYDGVVGRGSTIGSAVSDLREQIRTKLGL